MTVTRRGAGEIDERPRDFGEFVRRHGGAGNLVVQPRMGFSKPSEMRAGLAATKAAEATSVGTLTLDSYTRVGELDAAESALRDDLRLNGYPIVSHDPDTTRTVLAGIRDDSFPVQVRHGSAVPEDIFAAMVSLRLNASEGGPVSYCLPYGRTPLVDAVRNWEHCTKLFARLRDENVEPHLETFGGCMLGQLCPPSHLVALSVLEALFFCQHGVRSVSVSYAQQTDMEQDREAVFALRRLCEELLPTDNWHVVIYAYMGVYPQTDAGCYRLLGSAAELAATTDSERIIVKTVAESRRIPTIEENVAALEHAHQVARFSPTPVENAGFEDSETYEEAAALVHAVLNLGDDLGTALLRAFRQGYLDVPYCVHPDNQGRTRAFIDDGGRLRWAETGSLPLPNRPGSGRGHRMTSKDLLNSLSYVQMKFDSGALESGQTEHGRDFSRRLTN